MSKGKPPLNLIAGIVIISVICVLVMGAPVFTHYNPLEQYPEERLSTLSKAHLLGTDRFGRDIFSRTLYGGRTTLASSFLALVCSLVLGLLIGLTTGMFSGTIFDIIVMRIVDVLMAFPFMVLAMIITALFGTSLMHLLFVVAIIWWVPFARLTRSIVLQVKNETSVAAAKVLGANTRAIIFRELLPKVITPILILATFELGTLILSISALSFLGLGAQPPNPEWGSMLADGRAHFFQAPHVLLGPALFIVLTVLGLNFMGEGLRDYLDPYEIIKL